MFRLLPRPASTGLLVLALGLASCGSQPATNGGTPKIKIAVLLSVGLKDTGFGRAAAAGIDRVKNELGMDVAVSDLVPVPKQSEFLRNYATQGYRLIIADGVEYQDSATQAAKEFPSVDFVVINGYAAAAPNLAAVDFEWEQAGFLGGIAGGLATRSNKLGNIGGDKIPPIVRLFAGFAQGVKLVNPNALTTVSYVGSFIDSAKAKDLATAQLSQGNDVIYAIADTANTGVYEAVKEKNAKAIGYGADESSLAPNNIVTTTLIDYASIIFNLAKTFKNGQFNPTVKVEGFADNVLDLAPLHNVPDDVATKIRKYVDDAKAGKYPIQKAG